MAKRNGGIIGPANTPTASVAAGVWRLRDAFNSIKNGTWPLTRSVATNSLRFNSGSSDYLSRTPATTGTSRQIMTFSFWTKRSGFETTNAYRLFSTFYGGGASQFWIRFADSGEGINKISIASYDSGFSLNLITTQVFRDPSAWYHFVIAFDTTQATSSNRVKMYVNGEQVTSFSTSTYPSQNYNLQWNVTESNQIGGNGVSGNEYYNGYFSEIHFIDGQALTPSSFGASNSSGVWYPIPYQGSWGTNGFYLKFANSASLGTDSSGNNNTFTVNNLTSVDQSTDTELNNFCTLNPLSPADISSLTEGNLKITQSEAATAIATFGFGTGKWYWELKNTNQITYTQLVGVLKESTLQSTDPASFNLGANSGGWGYFIQSNADNGKAFNNNTTSSTYQTTANNDIISIAVDAGAGKIWFGVNGTWVNSGNPATGTNAVYTNLPTTGELLFPAVSNYDGGGFGTPTISFNFGAGTTYAGNGYTDGAGYGNFSYAVPSGYYALCTANLNTYG